MTLAQEGDGVMFVTDATNPFASFRAARGKRRRAAYTGPVQTVLDVSNEVAAELAGIGDGVLDALRDRLDCAVNLRETGSRCPATT